MTAPPFPQWFHCEECGAPVVSRRRWCGGRCKLRAWVRAHPDRTYTKQLVCPTCQQGFSSSGNRYCSDACKAKAKKPKHVNTRVCVVCAHAFTVRYKTSQQKTCGVVCRAARLATQLKGKKQRPAKTHEFTCGECRRPFTTSKRTKTACDRCVARRHRPHDHGKPKRRAARHRVPYVAGIKPAVVFERDHWRCQLCGCKTPQRLRGKNQPRSPEVDHIIPISQGGGHTWDNVQCVCRICNIKKGASVRGQLRLAI